MKNARPTDPAPVLVKGWEIVTVTVSPVHVREAREGEAHIASVSVALTRSARDGADVFTDGKQLTAHLDEPDVVSAARALLVAITHAAARKVSGPVFVQNGPDAATDYVSTK